MAYVKSNAYGHGLEKVVSVLNDYVDGYGVVGLDEGIMCRQFTDLPIVINAALSDSTSLTIMNEYRLEPVVHDLCFLKNILSSSFYWPRIWLKFNTGMNRLGIKPHDVDNAHQLLNKAKNIQTTVAMTHLADSCMSEENQHQLNLFRTITKSYPYQGSSYANSAANLESNDHQQGEWIRPGLLLYGWRPDSNLSSYLDFQPIMDVKSQVLSVQSIKKGESVGYGRDYVAKHDHLYAVVAFGYADGLPRGIVGGAVYKDGYGYPTIGRPSMDSVCIHERK